MKTCFAVFAGFAAMIVCGTANASLKSETVKYQAGTVESVGYLVWDDAIPGPRPGVLLVHEWWGLNDYARHRADELAKLGYLAFACDMYGGGKTTDHPKDAGAMATEVRNNVAEWRTRAQAALKLLADRPECDPARLAAIGYCFGGSTALELAYSGADLKAVATFHAALPTPTAEEAAAIKARLLICNGADDKFIPEAAITAFRKALDEAHVKYQFENYPGAVHSFTVKDAGQHGIEMMKYNAVADERSWAAMKGLFETTLLPDTTQVPDKK